MRVFAEPTNVTELLRFLGVLQYFGNHIDHLAHMAAPLCDVLKGTAWNKKKPRRKVIELNDWDSRWKETQHEAFLRLREVLADPGFLVPAREGARKRLCTDASRYGIGAVLLQQEDTGSWLPVNFASRKLKGAEPRYTTTERENSGVVFGLRKFRHYVYGEPFEVVTDHIALTWLMSLRDPKDRLARWIVEMQSYDFEVCTSEVMENSWLYPMRLVGTRWIVQSLCATIV
jgi:RNase H-like domain found in reverse transcriptase